MIINKILIFIIMYAFNCSIHHKNFVFLIFFYIFAKINKIMVNIYMAAYKDYANYEELKTVCDRITSDMNKNNVTFFVTTGESGDNTCFKYAKNNGFIVEDWFPEEELIELKNSIKENGHWRKFYNVKKTKKAEYISKADHVILVSDYDAKNNGIGYALRLAAKNGKTIYVLYPDKKEMHIHKISNPDITYIYSVNNGSMNFVGRVKT